MQYKQLPSILSFQRCFVLSDAVMYNRIPDPSGAEGFCETRRVRVIRHGVLGTQNVAGKDKDIKNPQRTETAKTDPDATGMRVTFSLSTITLDNALFACNDNDFRASVQGFVNRFRDSGEMQEICNRYARNILNGRWLWRNRILGNKIEVEVTVQDGTKDKSIKVDATGRPHASFGNYSDEERMLGNFLKESLTDRPIRFTVSAIIDFGMRGAIEVFPSQNYVSDKPKGFARSLYKLYRISREELMRIVSNDNPDSYFADMIDVGVAAIRDQKIGNAIRTIDTWYGDNPGEEMPPIPVEPKGANIESNECKRDKNGKDLFSMLRNIDDIKPAEDPETLNPSAMFVLANMVRGFLGGEANEKGENSKNGENGGGSKKGKRGEKGQKDEKNDNRERDGAQIQMELTQ